MHAFAAAGAGFLVAVLWFDLMFDVQVRRHRGETLPPDVLASISAYYRRVTTEAAQMSRLITMVMLATLAAAMAEIVLGPRWLGGLSALALVGAMGLVAVRTIPNAVRLGQAGDTAEVRSRLARSIYRDHLACLAAMTLVLGLQLAHAAAG